MEKRRLVGDGPWEPVQWEVRGRVMGKRAIGMAGGRNGMAAMRLTVASAE